MSAGEASGPRDYHGVSMSQTACIKDLKRLLGAERCLAEPGRLHRLAGEPLEVLG